MPPTAEVLQRAATALRTAVDGIGRTEATTARAFAAAGWQGPAARRFEAALHEQRSTVDHACRVLESFAARLDLDALEVRRTLLLPGAFLVACTAP